MYTAKIHSHGAGPGEIAEDGSAVEMYAALPRDTESAALVHGALPAAASILELGAGTGRVTHPLIALGHQVVAVDHSAGMLAHIEGAETVHSKIEDLSLGQTFDGVLLMSFLVEYSGPRQTLLDTCRRHVKPDGGVIIQRLTPNYHDEVAPLEWTRAGWDGWSFRIYDVERHGDGVFSATIESRIGERVWTHSFTSHRLGDEELPGLLARSGLRLDRYLDDDGSWILARPDP